MNKCPMGDLYKHAATATAFRVWGFEFRVQGLAFRAYQIKDATSLCGEGGCVAHRRWLGVAVAADWSHAGLHC